MEVIRFVVLGIATGGLFALLAQSLVLVYRGSGLLNFAQGAIALAGGFAYYQVTVLWGAPRYIGAVIAVLFCGLLGIGIHYGIMRPMRRSAPLQRVIATLGILMVLQSFAYLKYGYEVRRVPSLFPTGTVRIFSDQLMIGIDRLFIIGICLGVSAALYFGYRNTAFGRVTTAVAENQLAAASFGHSPDRVAAINWGLSSALAGFVGVLISPIIFLQPASLVLLVIPALSAGLFGAFSSFPLTLVTAFLLGISQSLLERYVDQPGWSTTAPFLAILIILLVQGRSLPLRSFVIERLPSIGTGHIRWVPAVVVCAVLGWLVNGMDADWATAMVSTMSIAIICLSVVVITGYTGQLSLAQYPLAGIGALLAARLAQHSVSFLLSIIVAAALTALIGVVMSIPAIRTRGITLAVVTLGLGGVLTDLILGNGKYSGGLAGLSVPTPSVFGWNIDPFLQPQRYALFVLVVVIVVSIGVCNLRRGSVGRRLLAVRSNERAAASLGVNVSSTKSYAFALSAAIAAVGGTLQAFSSPSVDLSGFTVFLGIVVVAVTVVGGVGYVPGALVGSLLVTGGVVTKALQSWSAVNTYLPLVGGIMLLATLVTAPNGLFALTRDRMAGVEWRAILHLPAGRSRASVVPVRSAPVRVEPRRLSVDNLSVSFGGVRAVRNVSLTVEPGEIHGILGPNGAGKTTLIDGITGFVRAQATSVCIGDVDIAGRSPRHRARAGVSRSFQSLELFTDMTVRENLAVACERPGPWRYLSELVRPGRISLNSAAWEAVHRFELTGLIDSHPEDVSFGHRKAIAIARAVASMPSVLLLDEPAAGLGAVEARELAELIEVLAHEWGIGILLVEHNVDLVLSISDRVTVIQSGSVLMSGSPTEVRESPAVIDAYLGASV